MFKRLRRTRYVATFAAVDVMSDIISVLSVNLFVHKNETHMIKFVATVIMLAIIGVSVFLRAKHMDDMTLDMIASGSVIDMNDSS